MAVNTKLIEQYMSEGLNIIISGEAGTGKTTMIQDAALGLGWKMKYYSTPTLDPMADLIGIPVPNHGRKTIDYYRPHEIDNAEIVFFDELNRGDLMVLNTVMEIIQFKSINGEPLRNLKCCVAAINPATDGYATRELDIALHDRFQIRLESDPNPSREFFIKRYGPSYAEAGLKLWYEYQDRINLGESLLYFSPRRLDTLLSVYQKFPLVDTLRAIVPGRGTINFEEWENLLSGSMGLSTAPIDTNLDERIERALSALRGRFEGNAYAKKEILETYLMSYTAEHQLLKKLRYQMILALNKQLSTPEDFIFWDRFLTTLSDAELEVLATDWPESKRIKIFDKHLGSNDLSSLTAS